MAEPILKKYMKNTQAESNPTEPIANDDINIELGKEFLIELKNNAYHGMFDEDMVDHIAKVLELLDLIKIPGVDFHRLRMMFFPLSLADDARQWVYKAEKFEAIKYSLGPNEEYNAIRRYEYNTWERNEERPRCKEIDKVGKVSTIWKSRSVGVLKSQDGCSTHILAHKLNLENLSSKILGEFLILILLILGFNVLSIQRGRLIMEYLVKVSKKERILELKRRNMKKTDSDIQYAVSNKEDTAYLCLHFTKDHEENKINTSYQENPIRRIQAMEIKYSGRYRTIDNPNITMEEYIRLEEEKAQKCGKVFNWEIAKYGKIWYDEDVHDLRSVETEFPGIIFNDNLTSNESLFCEPTVSSLNNNEIDFRISFDESDDEDYTVIYDKNSYSYKIISVDDLRTDLENDNDKVNMPLFPSPEPTVSYFDNLDYFKDFEKEFVAIVYNNALTSKLDFLTESTISPQRIDDFNLKDETSLSECEEEEQNVLYFNDLYPFNIIYPDNSKLNKDYDDDKIDIEQSSG
ncbi:hypothetical protein Tco_0685607, partial [Tanacetum coccineum]